MEGYKILTPNFRQEINKGFDDTIAELQSCERNGLVNAQIVSTIKMEYVQIIDILLMTISIVHLQKGESK